MNDLCRIVTAVEIVDQENQAFVSLYYRVYGLGNFFLKKLILAFLILRQIIEGNL